MFPANITPHVLTWDCPFLSAAAELDLEASNSSHSSPSDGETSDQEMDLDVSENAETASPYLALPASDSHALVPMPVRPNTSVGTSTVSVYRSDGRVSNVPHPHFRAASSSSVVSQAAGVAREVAPALTSSSELRNLNIRAITAGNELAKYNNQVSVESEASDDADAVLPIQYESTTASTAQRERMCIRESIISLLLRLHSKFNGQSDSYHFTDSCSYEAGHRVPNLSSAGQLVEEGRIGDGSFWIGKVLNKLCRIHPKIREAVASTSKALWPPRTSDGGSLNETSDEFKEREKRRKIKERQQRLLQEFATKQRQFMQQAMAAEDMDTDPEASSTGTMPPGASGATSVGTSGFRSPESSLKSDYRVNEDEHHPAASASTSNTATQEALPEEYDCVICNQASPSTSERPMCLVILLQATSILAHKRHQADHLALPVSEDDRLNLSSVETLASDMHKRIEDLRRHFDEASWLSSLNIGFEGGVYVHTCGHYLHLDCHKQYLQSLRSQQRQQSLNVDRGEYSCPLCRQLANSALPIANRLYGKNKAGFGQTPNTLVLGQSKTSDDIFKMLAHEPPISLHVGSNLMEAMGRVMEDMTNTTYPRFRQITSTPSPASLFLFVQSIARANLEIELLQRGGSITRDLVAMGRPSNSAGIVSPTYGHRSASRNVNVGMSNDSSPTPGTSSANWNSPGLELRFSSSPTTVSSGGAGTVSSSPSTSTWCLLPKRSCMLPLLHVLATHSKILTTRPYQRLWSDISGVDWCVSNQVDPLASISRCEREVPLLVQDVSCLLVQMVLVLPLPLGRLHFTCLVQRLFNLVLVQITAQQTVRIGAKKRNLYKTLAPSDWSLATVMAHVIHQLEDSPLYLEDDTGSRPQESSSSVNLEADIKQPLYQLALHFLRLASLLQFHLFGDELPTTSVSCTDHEEFVELCSFLNLAHEPLFDACIDPRAVIGRWCHEYLACLAESQFTARHLLMQHKLWKGPRLLTLPYSYDTLFQVSISCKIDQVVFREAGCVFTIVRL